MGLTVQHFKIKMENLGTMCRRHVEFTIKSMSKNRHRPRQFYLNLKDEHGRNVNAVLSLQDLIKLYDAIGDHVMFSKRNTHSVEKHSNCVHLNLEQDVTDRFIENLESLSKSV